jgi:uncharacterized phage protein (TIGR02218 family)
MTFPVRESSRTLGEPINLYLFKGADPTLESMLRSVTIIPGTTEFGYGTTKVTKDSVAANFLANLPVTDFEAALNDLTATATDLTHVSLVVAWHGTDLRAGSCEIRPKVETATAVTAPYEWRVGPIVRSSAQVVSQISGKPAVGGAPADRTIYEALIAIKARGLKVTLYPFIMMDIAADNALPNPYGGTTGQPAYPWRGRITCYPAPGQAGTVDKTSAAATQINSFFGTCSPSDFAWNVGAMAVAYAGPTEWSFRRFILHMATIAATVGVDDFLIGSELAGLTTVRSDATTFPAVAKLVTLAADVRTKLGAGPRISYAADWSEYHSYRPNDDSGDVFFHLDPLWASSNVDFVGIDNYLPLSDWRDGDLHLDRQTGYLTGYDVRYLQDNIEGGEYYDWFYASDAARNAQTRTPITDGAYDKPWVYRNKDVRSWWSNAHRNRPGGVESGSDTAWAPQSKPIVFTEVGCPAVDRGANQPNVFIDPKSSESDLPYFSAGREDAAMQRSFLEATLSYWNPSNGSNPTSSVYGTPMIEWDRISVWTWDARPFPAFPARTDVWGDAANWALGHWINGRVYAGRDFAAGDLGPYAYTNAEQPITKDGIVFQPSTISRGAITASGTLDKSMLEVRMAQGEDIDQLYIAYPPAQVLNLVIYQGHYGDDTSVLSNYPVVWTGRVLGVQHPANETVFTCEPVSTSIKRPGLRRNYQLSCPHVLYGEQCRANRKAATRNGTVASVTSTRVTMNAGWNGPLAPAKYNGGMLGWTKTDGTLELRSILRAEGNVLYLSGLPRGLASGMTAKVTLGCGRNMGDCSSLHNNIQNFGGQPWIPLTNPLAFVNNFY